jgi:phage terminase large subunit-like protein
MTFRQFWQLLRVPDVATGALVVPTPHQAQEEAIAALDAIDAAGDRRYPIHFWHWARKVAKDFMLAAYTLYHLGYDPWEQEPRYAAVAAWDAAQTQVTRRTAEQLIQRHPWLRAHYTVFRDSIIYREEVRESRTGGHYQVEHRAEFLNRDTKGAHGLNISLKIHNELWTDVDHSFEEALVASPSRRSPVTIFASYHALLSAMHKGTPFFDLLERVHQGDARIAYNYVGGQGDRAPEKIVPWISRTWMAEQQAAFAHAPNRYKRMVLNVPAGADSGLISPEELRDAIDRSLTRPTSGAPGQRYVLGCDLGLSNDYTALALVTTDADAKAVVTLTDTFRGTAAAPVDLSVVEDAIVDLARRFPLERCVMDAWNASLLATRLNRRGVPTQLVTTEASRLDRIITRLKAVFARRQIRLPAHETIVIEQLESVQTIEGRIGKRDTLKFAPSGRGPSAGLHDDHVIALGLALEVLGERVGRLMMDPMQVCNLERDGGIDTIERCYVAGGMYQPPRRQRLCAECPAHLSVLRAVAAYASRTGELVEAREFVARRLIEPSSYVTGRRFNSFIRDYL